MRHPALRLLVAVLLLAALLAGGFGLVLRWIQRWGATDREVARVYPGDDLLAEPLVLWTHAVTIRARPDAVWPWIARIGEGRGGFYSYTFIENLVARGRMYRNTNRIIPELQDPAAGQELIGGMMKVRAVEPGSWLLGNTYQQPWWTWVWLVEPGPRRATARLLVRVRIQPPAEMSGKPLVGFAFNAGGFVMERRMMQGIRMRAEGRSEPVHAQALEIALWLGALIVGVIAAVRFVRDARPVRRPGGGGGCGGGAVPVHILAACRGGTTPAGCRSGGTLLVEACRIRRGTPHPAAPWAGAARPASCLIPLRTASL